MKKPLVYSLIPLLLTACSIRQAPSVVPGVSWELAQHRKARISDINYRLNFTVPEAREEPIPATEVLTFELSDASTDLQLDFKETPEKIDAITVNGKPHDVELINEHLIVSGEMLNEGTNTVEIDFQAGETSLNRNPEYLYTLFVPDRARTVFPSFDQPNLKATYELTLDLPESWNAISNAQIETLERRDGRKVYQFRKSDLISTYLFSFVAGQFEAVTRVVNGREMTMLHRETDEEKVARNVDAIFAAHGDALTWLEEYTGIEYPFQKLDFALIPTFQYGGMEHVGAIQYRDRGLLLDEDPSPTRLLGRAGLIAHETAHMWFGDLVTMDWFNDVWTKEVFAGFMSSKAINPSFPEIDHELNKLVRRYPGAYAVDRSEGANPIRQELPNLNEAGNLYGGIIYAKAPIMMEQLEMLIGEEKFREGMQEYLSSYAHGNATWPALIEILDTKSDQDLKAWSEVWVNTAGRPEFRLETEGSRTLLLQSDPHDLGRVWPQSFSIASLEAPRTRNLRINSNAIQIHEDTELFINSDGKGYGLFPSSPSIITSRWEELPDQQKGAAFVHLYEQLLDGNAVAPEEYIELIRLTIEREDNELIVNLILGQLNNIYWSLLTPEQRQRVAPDLEATLWLAMNERATTPDRKKRFFQSFQNIAITEAGVGRLRNIWDQTLSPEDLNLSETDFIGLAGDLAVRVPQQANGIIDQQLARIANPDRKRRLEFIRTALSPDVAERDAFFESLKLEENRAIEPWVLAGLGYLHHPLRIEESEKYILPSLDLLQEIQMTGDIFFPARWLGQTLGSYQSASAVKTVRDFLAERPDYNNQLRMKILQAADMLFRAERIVGGDSG